MVDEISDREERRAKRRKIKRHNGPHKPVERPQKPVEASPMPRHSLRAFRLGEGLPNLTMLASEIQDMWDVLLGRIDPPEKIRGPLALMEVGDAYFARASEIKAMIQRLEREGRIEKSHALSKFRTGDLQTFMDVARKSADLGSRRLTEATLRAEAEMRGREYD